MKKITQIVIAVLLTVWLSACDKDEKELTMYVGPEKIQEEYAARYFIKWNADEEWTSIYNLVFPEYEEGFIYFIKVVRRDEKELIADGSSYYYYHTKTLSKTPVE